MFVPLSLLSSPPVIMLCRFGGHGGRHYYNTLSFDSSTRTWTELQCAGCILSPSARGGHAAALIGDINPCMFACCVDGRTGETAVVGKLNHLTHLCFLSTYDIQLSNGSHFKTWDQDQAEGWSCHGFQRDMGLCDRRGTINRRTADETAHSRPRLNPGHNVVKPSKKTT
jgi:hypothetical protein